jgi:hypothetical protein
MRLLLILLCCVTLSAAGQSLPDSVVVTQNEYVTNFQGEESLRHQERYSLLHKGKKYQLRGRIIAVSTVSKLLEEIAQASTVGSIWEAYKLDTVWIKNNPTKLLSMYSARENVAWNTPQKEFIFKELTNIANYKVALSYYLSIGCCYTMHRSYRNEHIIRVYEGGVISRDIKSRKYAAGYEMPWVSSTGKVLYSYDIESILATIINPNDKEKKPLQGEVSLRFLVNHIIEERMPTVYKLSAYSYQSAIEELKPEFEVVSFEEVRARGRYIWDEPKVIKIVLKNEEMLPNVSLAFMASVRSNTLYSRDSIRHDYKQLIARIQAIDFIASYLREHRTARLDAYYFDNKPINEYNVDNVNRNPVEWAKYDKQLERFDWYEKHGITSSFDVKEATNISKRLYCGCNYRYDKKYVEQFAFFEIIDEHHNNSIWFLLPNGNVLLYIMDGNKVLNHLRSEFSQKQEGGLLYPCVMFSKDGVILTK